VLIFPNTAPESGSALLLKSLRSELRGQVYDVDVIGLPMLSSVRDGCRAAAHQLLGA
jgi:hypothetical protein